ncbi:MAG: DUF2868 domain-containing protein [Candidatus Brocadiaceae bacterium]|nr:DUF2868 domain-containing protein [Candidatus Brocadiaceae bacterium]
MNELDARKVLLVKAIEEGDLTGKVLSKADRLVATQKIQSLLLPLPDKKQDKGTLNKKKELFLTKRAECLLQKVRNSHPASKIDITRIRWRGWITASLLILAFFLGFIANEFESGKRLNLLAFPVIGMLAWNFFIYILKAFVQIRNLFRRKSNKVNLGFLIHAISTLSTRLLNRNHVHPPNETSVFYKCIHDFNIEYLQLSAPIYKNHASRVLHLFATLFALGIIGGMYLRGFTTEYFAGWESTFLGPEAVHTFLKIVLMPAAIITDQQFPTLESIEAIRWGDGSIGENATDWIHLFTKTIFLFIIFPRCCLAIISFIRERHLRRHFPIKYDKHTYYKNLLFHKPGQNKLMLILPYTIELTEQRKEIVCSLFAQVLGWKSEVGFHKTIPYGGEEGFLKEFNSSTKTPAEYLTILFNLSSTPEDEIHNAFVNALEKAIVDSNTATKILIIVDESHFESRFSQQKDLKDKLESRRELWRRTITNKNFRPVFIDLHNPDTNEWQNDVDEGLKTLKEGTNEFN